MLVIASHTEILGKVSSASPFLARVISVFNADFGVKTFFVLSGFLITSLLMAEHRTTGRIDVVAFMVRRASRILPLYFLILALAVILILLHVARPGWTAALYSLFYVYNYLPHASEVNYLNHLWSLAVEEQFYIFWPLLFGFAFARGRPAVNTIAAILIGLCCLRVGLGYGDELARYSATIWTIPAILPIMVGALVAINIAALKPLLGKLVGLSAAIAAICSPLVLAAGAQTDLLAASGISGVVAWIYLNQGNALVRRMDYGLIGYLGTISYGLYMWQGFLTGNGPYRDANWPPNILIGAALTFPVAALSFKYFEQPIRSLARKHSREQQAAQMGLSA